MANASSVHHSGGYNNMTREDLSSVTEYLVRPEAQSQLKSTGMISGNQDIPSENTRSTNILEKVVPSYNQRERMQEYQSDKAF